MERKYRIVKNENDYFIIEKKNIFGWSRLKSYFGYHRKGKAGMYWYRKYASFKCKCVAEDYVKSLIEADIKKNTLVAFKWDWDIYHIDTSRVKSMFFWECGCDFTRWVEKK